MMISFKQIAFIVVLSVGSLSSCSLLPVSEEAKNAAYELSKEERFHLDEVPILEDKKLNAYLKRLTGTISDYYKIPQPFVVVADTIEAQGMMKYADNTIYISRGMLYAIKNEAELIALLGHEVGHVYLMHDRREYKSLEPVKDIIETVMDIEVSDVVLDQLEELHYSQFQKTLEVEADRFGVMTAQRLGYNPYEFASNAWN